MGIIDFRPTKIEDALGVAVEIFRRYNLLALNFHEDIAGALVAGGFSDYDGDIEAIKQSHENLSKLFRRHYDFLDEVPRIYGRAEEDILRWFDEEVVPAYNALHGGSEKVSRPPTTPPSGTRSTSPVFDFDAAVPCVDLTELLPASVSALDIKVSGAGSIASKEALTEKFMERAADFIYDGVSVASGEGKAAFVPLAAPSMDTIGVELSGVRAQDGLESNPSVYYSYGDTVARFSQWESTDDFSRKLGKISGVADTGASPINRLDLEGAKADILLKFIGAVGASGKGSGGASEAELKVKLAGLKHNFDVSGEAASGGVTSRYESVKVVSDEKLGLGAGPLGLGPVWRP